MALNREETEEKTYALAEQLRLPVVGGSDTHQAIQYGCIRTWMEKEVSEISDLWKEMQEKNTKSRLRTMPEIRFRMRHC